MFLGVEGFECFTHELPSIIAGLPDAPLLAFFGTYRYIGEYPSGPVKVDQPDLKIVIANGDGCSLSEMSDLFLDLATASARLGNQEINVKERLKHALRGQQQGIVDKALDDVNVPESESNRLVFLYCGPSGFTLAVNTARKFRAQYLAAIIVGTSCTCLKDDEIEDVQANNSPFDYFVTSRTCGMRWQMGKLVELLISSWKARKCSK
jgi:hypothetical protein